MRVLYCYPWAYFHPITSGADMVANNHLNFFKKMSWEVDIILLPFGDLQKEQAFRKQFDWVSSITILHEAEFILDATAMIGVISDLKPKIAGCIRGDTRLFFANYFFFAPLLDWLPNGCVSALENVDFLYNAWDSYYRDKTGAQRSFRVDLVRKIELDLYQLFDKVICLSVDEYNVVKEIMGEKVSLVPQMVPIDSSDAETEFTQTDLLFVGSNHIPNIDGINWFYSNVYKPYLRDDEIRLTIVGGVCRGIEIDKDDELVTLIPYLEGSIAPAYRRSKVTIAPLFQGTGMSIKAIECLGYGGVFYSTSIGARSLSDKYESFITDEMLHDPKATAKSLLRLLDDKQSRDLLGQNAIKHFAAEYSLERYLENLGKALSFVH